MRIRRPTDPELLKIYDKLVFYIDGRPLLYKDATDEQKQIFNKIKYKLKYKNMYNIFHGNQRKYLNLKNKIYFYHIPKDIFPYINYKKDQIIIKNTIPNELKEKANICKKILEIDFNYFFHIIKNISVFNGKEIGINNRFKFKTPLIIFVKSKDKIEFRENYNNVSETNYIKYRIYGKTSEKAIIRIGDKLME